MDPNSAGSVILDYTVIFIAGITFASAIVGALVGGYLSYKAILRSVILAHEKDLERQENAKKERLQWLYQAILTEIQTLWECYEEGVGNALKRAETAQAIRMIFPLGEERFTVYESNSELIGSIPDSELRKLIVTTYIRLRGIIDCCRLNNELVAKLRQFEETYAGTGNPIYKKLAEAQKEDMGKYTKSLKKENSEAKECMLKLVSKLEEKLEKG